MNANPVGFSENPRWIAPQRPRLARDKPQQPPILADLVEQWVRHRYASDLIFRGVERVFPPPDPTPAGRRGYREAIARLIVRYRHSGGRRGAA